MENAEISRDDIGFEFMLNALRLTGGVPASLFAERTGYPLSLVARELADASARGLVEPDPSTIRPTASGAAVPERPAGLVPARTRRRAAAATMLVRREPARDGH